MAYIGLPRTAVIKSHCVCYSYCKGRTTQVHAATSIQQAPTMNPEDNNKQTKHTVQDTGNEKETQVQEREVESPSTEAVANFAKQMAEFSYAIKVRCHETSLRYIAL